MDENGEIGNRGRREGMDENNEIGKKGRGERE